MIISLVAGLLALIVGAESLVRGASRIAAAVGIPQVVVGLTVVAFGTSGAELAVSIEGSLAGQADLALGNVIGSNVFNVFFILGLSALAAPLVVSSRLVRLDVPISIGVSLAAFLLVLDGSFSRIEGLVFVGALVAYTTFLIFQSRSAPSRDRSDRAAAATDDSAPALSVKKWVLYGGLTAGGLALLLLGAGWFIDGAVEAATRLGVSDLVVGLTIVAAGTSLPELATSVLATLRGQRDIAVANVVGSNIFNLLAVLGVSGAVSPAGISVPEAALWFDFPVLLAVSVVCLPIFFTGHRISRGEGALFLAYYAAYVVYLLLAATQHAALSSFSFAMGALVVPATLVTLGILWARAHRSGNRLSPDETRNGAA